MEYRLVILGGSDFQILTDDIQVIDFKGNVSLNVGAAEEVLGAKSWHEIESAFSPHVGEEMLSLSYNTGFQL